MSLLLSLSLFVLLVVMSFPAVRDQGGALFTFHWWPSEGLYGILPMLYGTLSVAAVAGLIAIPVGTLAAFYTAEMMEKRWRPYLRSIMEVLAGIPSVVYGLMGVAFLSVWIEELFALQSGRTILTAGIILGIMILPTVIALSDDALRSVSDRYRTSSAALGLYSYERFTSVLFPLARPGIVGAVLLGVGRALGETMAVMLVIGGIDRMPEPFLNLLAPGQTLTSKIGRSLSEAPFGSEKFHVFVFMGFLLLLIIVILVLLSQRSFRTKLDRS